MIFSQDFVGVSGFNHVEGSTKITSTETSSSSADRYSASQGRERVGFGGSIDIPAERRDQQSFVVTGTSALGRLPRRSRREWRGIPFPCSPASGRWPRLRGHRVLGYRLAKIDDTKLDGQSASPKVETTIREFSRGFGLASTFRETMRTRSRNAPRLSKPVDSRARP